MVYNSNYFFSSVDWPGDSTSPVGLASFDWAHVFMGWWIWWLWDYLPEQQGQLTRCLLSSIRLAPAHLHAGSHSVSRRSKRASPGVHTLFKPLRWVCWHHISKSRSYSQPWFQGKERDSPPSLLREEKDLSRSTCRYSALQIYARLLPAQPPDLSSLGSPGLSPPLITSTSWPKFIVKILVRFWNLLAYLCIKVKQRNKVKHI